VGPANHLRRVSLIFIVLQERRQNFTKACVTIPVNCLNKHEYQFSL
jgi:hypothetical protein